MFYNNAPTKTAVSNEGGTKYSPAATKKFIFFQLRDERGSEGEILVEARGRLSTPLTLVVKIQSNSNVFLVNSFA